MRIFLLVACAFFIPVNAFGQTADKAQQTVKKKSPFYKMYPAQLAPAAEAYFGQWNKALFKEGPIKAKAARLTAISASAAIRCEYCITAQVALGKAAGATDDEIKAAIQIAAEVSRFSILLYGNEFGQEKLKKIIEKMTQKPAAKADEKVAKKAGKKSPFYTMYPTKLADAAEGYFGQWNKALFKEGPIDTKAARLAAISASAAIRCEYCISAQVALAKVAGATDDEIKAAIQIAAEVSRFSILLYGNEFGQDALKKIIEKMTQKPANK